MTYSVASLWTIIEIFKEEDFVSETSYNEYLRGVRLIKNSGRRMQELKSLVTNYSQMVKLDFLIEVGRIYAA